MKFFNFQDLYKEDSEVDDDEEIDFSEEEIKNNLPKQSSTKLADIVLSFRYLGLYKELSVSAMEELAKRRLDGDSFQYEKYIEDNLNNLPKLDFKVPDFNNILKTYGKK